MTYLAYVDMSAKVEQWSWNSAIAISNGSSRVYLIPGRVKQEVRRLLIRLYGEKSIEYRTFALLVFLIVRDELANISQLIIDRDYTGNEAEATIKNLLFPWLHASRPGVTSGFIRFENVRGSKVDKLARKVYAGEAKADKKISFTEVEALVLSYERSRGS